MINSEIYLKDISSSLALLSREIEIYNCVNFYDINIVAEDFYAQLLNLIYGINLCNLNAYEKNATAIDLGDKKTRIAIQVTSDNDSKKIKKTIDKFIEYQHYLKYDRLIVLMLTKKKKYSVNFDTKSKFKFDKKSDIIDYLDLMKVINKKNTQELEEISSFLERELTSKIESERTTNASEVDTIIDLIEYITKNRELKKKLDTVVDPEYKIQKRFKEFAERLIDDYTSLYTIYGDALEMVHTILEIDEALDIITIMYLQDISIKILDETKNNPVEALNKLVEFFEERLSKNGKRYDRASIKFYLINETIKCNVFPNERSEYNVDKW